MCQKILTYPEGLKPAQKVRFHFLGRSPIETQLLDRVGISRGIETSTLVSDMESLSRAGVSNMSTSPEELKPAQKE